MSATIEPAGPADHEDLHGLLREFLETIGEAAMDDDGFARVAKALEEGRIRFFIAREEGRPVGLCSLTTGFTTYRTAPFGLMEDFYVVPDRRKSGLVRQLLDALLAEAAALGCRTVVGACSAGDVPMWQHFGFREIGQMISIDL